MPISLPQDNGEGMETSIGPQSMESAEASVDDEPSIIFEIPPDLDDRTVREQLGRNRGSRFDQLIEVNGTDALGWYFPFHYQIAQHGIYISSRGAVELAIHVFRHKYSDDPHEDLSRRLNYAVHLILRHEAFHFVTECMAANWELALGSACYIKARERLQAQADTLSKKKLSQTHT